MRLKIVTADKIKNKTVLYRVDYDVPIDKKIGKVLDDTRIKVTLPTLHFLLKHHAKVIIICKRGRPDGVVVESERLDPIAKHLAILIKRPVRKLDETVGTKVEIEVNSMRPGDVIMLENTRFHPGETKNDPVFAKQLAHLGDIVVNDAFPLVHRAHASVSGIAKFLPVAAGFYLEKEVTMLGSLLKSPKRPFVAIIGGAKVSDKIDAIQNLSEIADVVLVGGGVANNFLKAQGVEVYSSYLQDVVADEKKRGVDFTKVAKKLIKETRNDRLLLDSFIPLPKIVYPIDAVAAESKDNPTKIETVGLVNGALKNGNKKWMYLDIGPQTQKLYRRIIHEAKTIFWNGPMGVFENSLFAKGTRAIAGAIAESHATSILGGGDTVSSIHHLGFTDSDFTYISAAGGAALDFLAGKKLPGLEPMIVKK